MAKRFYRTLVTARGATSQKAKQIFAGSDHADLAGNCQSPVFVPITGMSDARLHRLKQIDQILLHDGPFTDWCPQRGLIDCYGNPIRHEFRKPDPVNVDLAVRCRKCVACLKSRAAHWRMRALQEYRLAARTWFGTLTLAPLAHFKALSLARHSLAAQGIDFESLSDEDQLAERHRQISPLITLMLKRVRKRSGATIRFLCVMEAHKSGLPHYHLLIHQSIGTVLHRQLQSSWDHGFSNWKLVADEAAAAYVCKYLAKSALARVRASVKYGTSGRELALGEVSAITTRSRLDGRSIF